MVLLDKKEYDKVIGPLRKVTFNNLFAQFVVEKHVEGYVYVDDPKKPGSFLIAHPYGMSLLFGKCDNEEFNSSFCEYALNIPKKREKSEWLQVFPDTWDSKIEVMLAHNLIKSKDNVKNDKSKIEVNTRVNFKFNREKYRKLKNEKKTSDYKILQTDKEMFEKMNGSVVPKHFWNNNEDFLKSGIGFTLFNQGNIASTAFSAFILDTYLELGIETVEVNRGKGLAEQACSALIDYCLNNNYEPVWSCRLENAGSCKLAQKLGFEPTLFIPYYKLCEMSCLKKR